MKRALFISCCILITYAFVYGVSLHIGLASAASLFTFAILNALID